MYTKYLYYYVRVNFISRVRSYFILVPSGYDQVRPLYPLGMTVFDHFTLWV